MQGSFQEASSPGCCRLNDPLVEEQVGCSAHPDRPPGHFLGRPHHPHGVVAEEGGGVGVWAFIVRGEDWSYLKTSEKGLLKGLMPVLLCNYTWTPSPSSPPISP